MLKKHFEKALIHMSSVVETTVRELLLHLKKCLEPAASAEDVSKRTMRFAYLASRHNEILITGAGLQFTETNAYAQHARKYFGKMEE